MSSYRWKYFKQLTNYFEWTLFLCVLYFMFPIRQTKTERQFGAAAIAICISWFDLIWFLRRIPDIGTFILTIQKTTKTLMKVRNEMKYNKYTLRRVVPILYMWCYTFKGEIHQFLLFNNNILTLKITKRQKFDEDGKNLNIQSILTIHISYIVIRIVG